MTNYSLIPYNILKEEFEREGLDFNKIKFSFEKNIEPEEKSYSLREVKDEYECGVLSLDESVKAINTWRNKTMYICFNEIDNKDKSNFIFIKASKRGNDVYRWRVKQRYKRLLDFCKENKDKNYILKDKKIGYCCQIFKCTHTVNPHEYELDLFNKETSSKEYDKCIKTFRNEYPDVEVTRTYEVSKNGYLHINTVLYFPSHKFPVYLHSSKKYRDSKGKPRKSWRLREKQDLDFFKNSWECGFLDVRAVENCNDLSEYSLKYHIKYFKNEKSKKNQELTLSVLSLFNKRAFSIPDSFVDGIIEYTCSIDDSIVLNNQRLDIVMHNSLNGNLSYEFVGVFSSESLKIEDDEWFFTSKKPPPEELYDKTPKKLRFHVFR